MRVLAAPDKFRGTATAGEIARALAEGARAVGLEATELPLADGGEGTLDALGGANRWSIVPGPLGDPVRAGWRLAGELAVIELAAASGLQLAGGADGNDPVRADTAGIGQLIDEALRRGARRVIIAVGGSASTDGGLGAIREIDRTALLDAELIIACDVRTQFMDAARVFAPQKGAGRDAVEQLTARLERLARMYRSKFGVDLDGVERAGAAGGFAGGMLALGGRLVDGFGLVAEHVRLDARLSAVDIVLTGEGCLDRTSFGGKVVGGVIARSAAGTRTGVVAGRVDHCPPTVTAVSLVRLFGEREARQDPARCASRAARILLERLMRAHWSDD